MQKFTLTLLVLSVGTIVAADDWYRGVSSPSSSLSYQVPKVASIFHEINALMTAHRGSEALVRCAEIARNPFHVVQHKALALALMGSIYAAKGMPECDFIKAAEYYDRALSLKNGLSGSVRDQVLEYRRVVASGFFLSSLLTVVQEERSALKKQEKKAAYAKIRAFRS